MEKSYFSQEWFEYLCEGFKGNKSIVHLSLSGCKLNNLKLRPLGEALAMNRSISNLNISNNSLETQLEEMFQMIRNSKYLSVLKTLDLSGNPNLDSSGVNSLFINLKIFDSQLIPITNEKKIEITNLNLSKCNLSMDLFQNIYQNQTSYKDIYAFKYL